MSKKLSLTFLGIIIVLFIVLLLPQAVRVLAGSEAIIGTTSPSTLSSAPDACSSDSDCSSGQSCVSGLCTTAETTPQITKQQNTDFSPDTSFPPVQSAWSPASGSTIATATPTISLTLDKNGDCKSSTTDQSYDDMSTTCSGGGTASISCTINNLGSDGPKNVYISCEDTLGNKDTAGTATHLSYTLDTTPPVPTGGGYGNALNLHDITTGSNGTCGGTYFCTATEGYDAPTGFGTPNGSAAF